MVPKVGCLPGALGLNIATAPAMTQAKPTVICKPTTVRKYGEVEGISIRREP